MLNLEYREFMGGGLVLHFKTSQFFGDPINVTVLALYHEIMDLFGHKVLGEAF